METMEIQSSSVDLALAIVYTKLLKGGENRVFRVQLRSVEMTTNCFTVFTYIFDVVQMN